MREVVSVLTGTLADPRMGQWIVLPSLLFSKRDAPAWELDGESYPAPIRANSGQVVPQTRSKISGELPAALSPLPVAHCEKLGQPFLVVIFNYLL